MFLCTRKSNVLGPAAGEGGDGQENVRNTVRL